MLGFRFATYAQIKDIVESSDFTQYTIIGVQIFASSFIILKLIHAFIKDVSGQNKMSNVIETFGLIVFISLAPYAITLIEDCFSFVDNAIASHNTNSIPSAIKMALIESTMEKETGFISGLNPMNGINAIIMGLLGVVAFLIYAFDSAIFAIFMLERLVLIEFFRFVFPLFIAFIGIDGLRNKYWNWVTSFIGLMILPIPYIAIYHIIEAIQTLLFDMNKSSGSAGSLLFNLLITIMILITTVGIKIKLLTGVTEKVTKLF